MGSASNEKQRFSQLTSAVRRLQTRRMELSVVCGDFNSSMETDSCLRALLSEFGLCKVSGTGPTYALHGYMDTLDHIWAGKSLQVQAILGSEAPAVRSLVAAGGLPDVEHPSDHLPVAACFRIADARMVFLPEFEHPPTLSEAERKEWVEISRLADPRAGKKSAREQKRLEADFLG